MYVEYYNIANGIDRSQIRRPVELDMEKYKKLWKPNDLWRLATASFNLGISIDCVYDHVIRLMRNVIERFPDGYIGPASNAFIARLSGWPLSNSFDWAHAIKPQPDFAFFIRPSDGFFKMVPASDNICEIVKANNGIYEPTKTRVPMSDILSQTVKCCYVVRDLNQWKYYIENSDPEIGQGDWGDVILNSGLQPRILELDTPKEYQRMLGEYIENPYERMPLETMFYDLPDELHRQIEDGIGDKPWIDIVREYNEGPEKQYVWDASKKKLVDKEGRPRVHSYTLNERAQMLRHIVNQPMDDAIQKLTSPSIVPDGHRVHMDPPPPSDGFVRAFALKTF